LEVLGVEERIILKWALKQLDGRAWKDWYDRDNGRTVVSWVMNVRVS
jgi:hypothetical protein